MIREIEPHEKGCTCFSCEWYRKQTEIEEQKKHVMKTELKHNPFATALKELKDEKRQMLDELRAANEATAE